MVRILEPLLSERVEATPAASVLTQIDIDLDLERSRAAALILAIEGDGIGAALADRDNVIWAVVARPDVPVVSVTDFTEPFRDPDYIGGIERTYDILTSGAVLESRSGQDTKYIVPGGGYLVTRRMSAFVFNDDGSTVQGVRIWYKMVLLSDAEIADFFFLRR